MLNYTFKAKNREGVLICGDMSADRRENVVNSLKQKGYYLLSIEPESQLSSILTAIGGFHRRVSVRNRAIFTHQLATLLKAGMRLSIAYPKLWQSTRGSFLKFTLLSLRRPKNPAA
jgi:type II secretory pathway component PulF